MYPSKDYYKPTRSSVLRQMPRHSLAGADTGEGEKEDGHNSEEEDKAEAALYNTGNNTASSPSRGKVSAGAVRAANSAGGRGGTAGGCGASVGGGGDSIGASARSLGGGSTVTGSRVGSQVGGGRNQQAGLAGSKGAAGTGTGASRQGTRGQSRKSGTASSDPDMPINRYVHRGLKESNTVKKMRQEQREHTLGQIEEVLQGLNAHTTNWSERQVQQGVNSTHNRGHAAKSEKETMREMRDFAQPFTGVKSLLNMVADIENEFNS